MKIRTLLTWAVVVSIAPQCVRSLSAATEPIPADGALMQALVDELNRSMALQMEDLEKPYFIQYSVDDTLFYDLEARYGAITGSQRDRSRRFYSRVRVGSYDLDNTNFAGDQGFFFSGRGGGGGRAGLPIDDGYAAIRQAVWRATDEDYKSAVETLTKKRAYMRDKTFDRPDHDFSRAEAVEQLDPPAVLDFDKGKWEKNLKRITAHFKQHPQVQDSSARLLVGAGNAYVVNSEGTRVRTADTGTLLFVTAEVQAEDGMRLSANRSYAGDTTEDFPSVDQILADIDDLVNHLTAAMNAETVEHYAGPVLFDGHAAGQMFRVMLAEGVAGQVDPVGTQRRQFEGAENLEKKFGQRILPKSFQVYDDPTVKKVKDSILLGHYRFDDEGVPARRVDIVKDGQLVGMCMSRVPTKKLSGSNGHARRAPRGTDPQAAVGALFIEDQEGVSDEQLKAALIEAAKDNGLDYGVRVESIRSAGLGSTQSDIFAFLMRSRGGGGSNVGDPVIASKVYVEDGREEPIRGCEFGRVEGAALKRILAAGNAPQVYNYVAFTGAAPPATIVAPAVLFEELELSKIEQEHDQLPILKAPLLR